MGHLKLNYRGYVLYPFSSLDHGGFAAMLIVEGHDGLQRATGVIEYYENSDLACQAAIDYGITLIDQINKELFA